VILYTWNGSAWHGGTAQPWGAMGGHGAMLKDGKVGENCNGWGVEF